MFLLIFFITMINANKICLNCKNFNPLINKCFVDQTLNENSKISICKTHLEDYITTQLSNILLDKIYKIEYLQDLEEYKLHKIAEDFYDQYDFITKKNENKM